MTRFRSQDPLLLEDKEGGVRTRDDAVTEEGALRPWWTQLDENNKNPNMPSIPLLSAAMLPAVSTVMQSTRSR